MNDLDKYTLTPRGEQELRGSVTTLSSAEIELLVRIDGALTFAQIKAGMPAVTVETLTSTFNRLLDRRLLMLVRDDPFSDQFQIQLNKRALTHFEAQTDSGAASLKKTGYYVNIARPSEPARKLAPGAVLSAIVVEDEPMLAKFIQSYLACDGFHVRLADAKRFAPMETTLGYRHVLWNRRGSSHILK